MRYMRWAAIAFAAVWTAACGGGGGGSGGGTAPPPSPPPPPPPPPPPAFSAANDSVSLNANAETSIAVLDNDEYGSESPTVSIVDSPAQGEASTDGSTITYTPRLDFTGSETIRYRITASDDRTSEATVEIEVNAGNWVGIGGVVNTDAAATSALAGAQCEYHAPVGERLGTSTATSTADDDGAFYMLAPADSSGYLVCWPSGLSRAGLYSFLATGEAGERLSGRTVSPGSTVIALLLEMERARDPAVDLSARSSALTGSLSGDAHFGLLADVAESLFADLRSEEINTSFFDLLIDGFYNSRIDNPELSASAEVLNGSILDVENEAGADAFAAATRTFADLALLAWAHGMDDPAPPPPLAPDPASLDRVADDYRNTEFGANPSLADMNAHWAYARGATGEGETVGMTDTGLYAAHEEFSGRLHDETVYTVIGDDTNGDGSPEYSYFKVGENPPSAAYPSAQPDDDTRCEGVFCKFYYYSHGTQMGSLAVGARNGVDAHGVAFGARLLFRPYRQQGSLIGVDYYLSPGETPNPEAPTRHELVRQVGDMVPVVSNSWLTGGSDFAPDSSEDWRYPFWEGLTPRYAGYQHDRNSPRRAILLWSQGNVPLPGGPLTDGAAVPSVTERQIRAATGGARGLADVLLTEDQRAGLSEEEALRRAQQAVEAIKRQWLAVAALADNDDSVAGRRTRRAQCATASGSGGADCAVEFTLGASSRCGFASDWCVAAGATWGGVFADLRNAPQPTGSYFIDAYRTSEAAAAAGGALGVLLDAYRDGDGQLTVGTSAVLKRLKATANRDVFDPADRHDQDGRNLLLREEDSIRALVSFAESSDSDLRALISAARTELTGLLPGIPNADLLQEETLKHLRRPFSSTQRALIASAKDSLDDAQWNRFRVLNRLVYLTAFWREIDSFPPQLNRIRELLAWADQSDAQANDLLAQLIRQVEWIDEQLRRLDRTKYTATAEDIRRIAVISLIGHGLIDLKAATDPAS